MSYPRNMAGAVALLASSSLLGLGCAVATDGQGKDTDDQSVVADNAVTAEGQTQSDESALATDDGSGADTEATGESKDALWYGGYGYGYPFFGFRRFGYGYGYPFYGFRRFGYPFYGYPGYGFGGCGYGLGC